MSAPIFDERNAQYVQLAVLEWTNTPFRVRNRDGHMGRKTAGLKRRDNGRRWEKWQIECVAIN